MTLAAKISPSRAQTLIAEKLTPKVVPAATSLSETLVRLGRLDQPQVDDVNTVVSKRGGAFGKTAVKLGMLKPQDLTFALGVHLGFLHPSAQSVAIPKALLVARNPYSAGAEQFRKMRTRLVTGEGARLNVFSITGADHSVDAGFIAVNLAASFAQLGKRVLMIDADLRRPSMAAMFGAARAVGVTEVIGGSASYEEAAQATLVKNLDLLPAGMKAPDPQSSLANPDFTKLIERSKTEYDIVMVLTSPFGKFADSEFIWAAAKEVLVVAQKHHTRSDDLSALRSSVRQAGADILGAAITA